MTILFSSRNTRSVSYILSSTPNLFTTNPQNPLNKSSTTSIPHRYAHSLTTPSRRIPTASFTMPQQKQEKVRVYTKADHTSTDKLASSLASAFENDPLSRFAYGSDHNDMLYENKILFHSLLNMELSRPDGQTTIHVSDDDSAVAIWHHVGHWEMPLSMVISLPFILIRTLGWRAIRFMRTVYRIEQAHPHQPHMHLFIIGTDAQSQGKGNGSKVISKMLQHCDAHGIAAYLESSSERNVPFYEKHGFKVTQKIPNMLEGCPPVSAMWRDPKPPPDSPQH